MKRLAAMTKLRLDSTTAGLWSRARRGQGFFDSRVERVLEYHPVGASTADLAPLRDPSARIHFLIVDTDLA